MLRPMLNWECTKNLRLIHEPTLVTDSVLDAFKARFRNYCFESFCRVRRLMLFGSDKIWLSLFTYEDDQ
jgi:hypothetical protein